MPLPNRRRVSLRLTPWLIFLLGGCSLLPFGELSSQYSNGGSGADGGQPTTGGASGEGGEGGQSGRGGSGNRGGDDTGGAGTGGVGGGPVGGDSGAGGDPSPQPDSGGGGADGGSSQAADDCDDGKRNNQETDIDCGGGICVLCGDRKTCGDDDDCVSGSCPGGRICEPPTCDDNRWNGNETDTDCGGPDDCAPCPIGDRCEGLDDCEIPLNSLNLCTEEKRCDSDCEGDFLDCDTPKGCEVNPKDDVDHCGDCDTECSDNNGTPDCNDGDCEIACDASFDDCTGGVADGCETNTFTSEEHCGDCNVACANECVDGECCVDLAPNINQTTACFTVSPEPACDSITIQKQDPGSVAYTTTSTCNAGGTLQGNGVSVNLAVCRTTFHLAAAANMRWWKSGCD